MHWDDLSRFEQVETEDEHIVLYQQVLNHVQFQCNVNLVLVLDTKHNRRAVLFSTDLDMEALTMYRYYKARFQIEQDYQQMKSGGWQLKKLSSTRYSEIVFYILTVVLSYSLFHLFCNTRAGARFADKTRQALAFEQLRSRRTHIIAYAGGYFEIFETLSFARFILQLPASAQDRLRHWFDEHLHTVQQRK